MNFRYKYEEEARANPANICDHAVYNGEKYIAWAVQSVYAQDVPLELIIIDDGSVDGTRKALIPWENRPDFVYIKNERNLGAAGSHNRGVCAKGRYVAFLDYG